METGVNVWVLCRTIKVPARTRRGQCCIKATLKDPSSVFCHIHLSCMYVCCTNRRIYVNFYMDKFNSKQTKTIFWRKKETNYPWLWWWLFDIQLVCTRTCLCVWNITITKVSPIFFFFLLQHCRFLFLTVTLKRFHPLRSLNCFTPPLLNKGRATKISVETIKCVTDNWIYQCG